MNDFKDIHEVEEAIKRAYMEKDYYNSWRFNYHFNPPFGLINDPNGLSYYNGYYHIFFQWYPYGCEHGLKHWGLIKTKDFINYTMPELVLVPQDWYDKSGCYSGSGIVHGNLFNIFYTGNVKVEDNRLSYQCLATMDKQGNFKKHGPVIQTIPDGYTSHFRDPYVFYHKDRYYMILGAQSKDFEGKIVAYESRDLINWYVKGEINTNLKEFGYMWECPNYVKFEDKDALIFSPQGLKREKFKYQNIYNSGYVLGKLDFENLNFSHGEFYELDMGFDFYAPQVMTDNKGRSIMIAWMGIPEDEELHPSIEEGWIHGLTMPRQLIIKDNILYQQPVEELKGLRGDSFFVEDLIFNRYTHEKLKGDSYELFLNIESYKSEGFEIRMASNEDEYLSFKYDFKNNVVILDRNHIKLGPKGVRRVKIEKSDSIQLQIFMDKSAVEIYINGGKKVMTSRLFPSKNSQNVEILSINGEGRIKELKFWELKGVSYHG